MSDQGSSRSIGLGIDPRIRAPGGCLPAGADPTSRECARTPPRAPTMAARRAGPARKLVGDDAALRDEQAELGCAHARRQARVASILDGGT
jgi:hypothetical protein